MTSGKVPRGVSRLVGAAALALASLPAVLPAQTGHRVYTPAQIAWGPERNGISSAVLAGDRAVAGGTYALALRLADGAWIPPHFHPNDKQVVVLSGTLLMGMGDSVVAERAERVMQGAVVTVPANSHHFEGAHGETVLLLFGSGPLTTTYVGPDGRALKARPE